MLTRVVICNKPSDQAINRKYTNQPVTPWKSIAPSWVLQHRDIPHFCNSFWNPLRNTFDPSDHESRPSRELGQAGLNSSSFQVIIMKVLFLSTTKTGLSLDLSPKNILISRTMLVTIILGLALSKYLLRPPHPSAYWE